MIIIDNISFILFEEIGVTIDNLNKSGTFLFEKMIKNIFDGKSSANLFALNSLNLILSKPSEESFLI